VADKNKSSKAAERARAAHRISDVHLSDVKLPDSMGGNDTPKEVVYEPAYAEQEEQDFAE
jgi:hypothetical protein